MENIDSPKRLIEAYRSGIFPWFNENETILWWSPDPRMVLFPSELRISRSLNKVLRNRNYEVRFDSDFSQVIQACAAPRKGQNGTWIHSDMISAYTVLHKMGLAHVLWQLDFGGVSRHDVECGWEKNRLRRHVLERRLCSDHNKGDK